MSDSVLPARLILHMADRLADSALMIRSTTKNLDSSKEYSLKITSENFHRFLPDSLKVTLIYYKIVQIYLRDPADMPVSVHVQMSVIYLVLRLVTPKEC